jgi:putative transposase
MKPCGSGRANSASSSPTGSVVAFLAWADKWHFDEVVLKIAGVSGCGEPWTTGIVLDVLVQRRRDKRAAKRLLRKLLKKQMRPPRVMITDKLASYGAAKRDIMPGIEHRQHKGLNNRAENSDQPTRGRAATNGGVQIRRPGPALQINDLFHLRRDHATFRHRAAGTRTFRSGRKSAAGSPLQYKPPTYLAYPLESG